MRRPSLLADDRGQMQGPDLPGVIIMIGIAVVAGFVVLFLASEVIGATNFSTGDPNTTHPLAPARDDLVSATDSVFGLFGLLFLVVVLSVAIIYLYAIRGAR